VSIITLDEAKTYLGITGVGSDSLIKAYIPIVQRRVVEICNNPFLSSYVHGRLMLENQDVVFSTNAMTASSSFADAGFAAGDEIVIDGSYRNNGYYTISTVSTYTVTLQASAGTVVSEISGASIVIGVVNWPIGIKPVVANMIKYDMDVRPTLKGVSSESIGDYSVTYTNGGGYGYPMDLLYGLSIYQIPHYV
jgi:hypothetical protein